MARKAIRVITHVTYYLCIILIIGLVGSLETDSITFEQAIGKGLIYSIILIVSMIVNDLNENH